jgi:homoaconitate hydratase
MGSPLAQAYLASPAVVAASAIAGHIDLPGEFKSSRPLGEARFGQKTNVASGPVTVIRNFPEKVEGELIFCHQDNLNTDGIFPGKYTYRDDFSPEQQSQVVMENYDPEFGKIVRAGDIVVGGFNFGTGSSREQAATALKHRGIRLVIAGSFSETYKRNAINNGFLVIEAPDLVNDFKGKFGIDRLTVKTGILANVDFRHSRISADGENYPIGPVGAAAQELIVAGGLENWVKRNLG